MKKIITAILATAFVAGVAMSPAHATDNQASARAKAFLKLKDLYKNRTCNGCRKPNPNAKNDALTIEEAERLGLPTQ